MYGALDEAVVDADTLLEAARLFYAALFGLWPARFAKIFPAIAHPPTQPANALHSTCYRVKQARDPCQSNHTLVHHLRSASPHCTVQASPGSRL